MIFEIPVSWQLVCLFWAAMAMVVQFIALSVRFLIGSYTLSLLPLPRFIDAPFCVCWIGNHWFETVNFSYLHEHRASNSRSPGKHVKSPASVVKNLRK